MSEVGMTVIDVQKEVEGFVYNRLQGALLRGAYCLVRDGVVEPEDIDKIVHDGIGVVGQ
jgi:3-hydroxyacyl-CoA dehydrogenase